MRRGKVRSAQRREGRVQRAQSGQVDLDRLRNARQTLAELVAIEPRYAPIFARLDEETALAEATLVEDPLERARAIARQARSVRRR